MVKNVTLADWRVNTAGLLNEVLMNPTCGILSKPIQIFGQILAEVADRAIEINDPKLNALMCRLALYEESDPYSKEYDSKKVHRTIKKGTKKEKKDHLEYGKAM